jgi:hypothetical protein
MSPRHRHRRGSTGSSKTRPQGQAAGSRNEGQADDSLADQFLQYGELLVKMPGPLEVELSAASLVTMQRAHGLPQQLCDQTITSALVEDVAGYPSEESAAVLRAIIAVGSQPQRSAATSALGEITASGFYPPAWAATIGRPSLVAAWKRYDVFGDTETIAIEFAYGPDRHVLLVRTDLFRPPAATRITVDDDAEAVIASLRDGTDPLSRWEDLDLVAARARLEPALARCDRGRMPDLTADSLARLPVARARMRRLPKPPAGAPEVAPEAAFDADDRRSAVSAFLASLAALDAADPAIVRFWAELLAGYSSQVPGTPPTRVGPLRLWHILLGYVPTMVELTPAQRLGMPTAVSAWVSWAAAVEELDAAARDLLAAQVPTVLARFDAAYDDPDNAQHRAYLRDLPATTTDASARAAVLARRAIAVPTPDARTGDSAKRIIDVADPAERRAVIRDEYGDCDPPDGMRQTAFLDAVEQVAEQLWHDDPPQTWQTARRLLAHGVGQHEILHELAQSIG